MIIRSIHGRRENGMSIPTGPLLVILYLIGTGIALVVAVGDSIPLQRDWGRMALGVYVTGALLSVCVLAGNASESRKVRAHIAIGLAVLVGAAIVPMALEVWWRATQGYPTHVQSEVLVTEESAAALLSGSNPYSASFVAGPLGSWPKGTSEHVPYFPGIFLFGIPRALGSSALADARIYFAGVAIVALYSALKISRPPPTRGLIAFLIVFALPTGARYMTGGGDDVTVLALMLLSLVWLREGSNIKAALVATLAAAIKQTAWPMLPFLVIAVHHRSGRHGSSQVLSVISATLLLTTLPFIIWNAEAFLEDVVLFPLGLASDPTLAASPTIGRLLSTLLPDAAVTATSLVVIGIAYYLLMVVYPPDDARGVGDRTAIVLTLAILLATAGRFGYLLYSVGLWVWGRLVLAPTPQGSSDPEVERLDSLHP